MEDLVRSFVDEGLENLESFSRALVRLEPLLEQGSDATEAIDALFRYIHSIKGAAGFLAFAAIERVSHAGEDVLALLRTGELTISAPLVSTLLSMADSLTDYLADISATGAERARDDTALLSQLTASMRGSREHRPDEALHATGPTTASITRAQLGNSIRVRVETIDNLARLLGELVTCRNELRQLASESDDRQLQRQVQTLTSLTDGLRDGVLNARMQRVGNVWKSLPKLAREVAVGSGKRVSITTDGADIELDRHVLDAVRDPLVHMVRNAVDHGIESPETRVALGKAPDGVLALRAEYTAGQVLIELADDGRGIDPAVVSRRAVELGLITSREAVSMSEAELVRLVLRPGFSTSGSVTTVSGRGVGMDVVCTEIERVGGSIDLVSVPGHGTTVRLTVPRSVAITQVLTLSMDGCRLALPQAQVVELVRLTAAEVRATVGLSHDGPVLRWRGATLPLVDLAELLGLATREERDTGEVTIVVASAGAGSIALSVTGLLDTEEIVVRPLGRHLQHLGLYAGSAVLPDGGVALLLDIAGVVSAARRQPASEAAPDALHDGDDGCASEFLTVDVGAGRQLAIPLDLVVRLVEVDSDTIELAGSWEILRLGDQLVPLVRVPAPLAVTDGDRPGARTTVVVVRTSRGQDVGFVVRSVGDIATATTELPLEEPGLDGVAVLRGLVTGQLDVRAAALEVLDQFACLDAQPLGAVEHFATARSR